MCHVRFRLHELRLHPARLRTIHMPRALLGIQAIVLVESESSHPLATTSSTANVHHVPNAIDFGRRIDRCVIRRSADRAIAVGSFCIKSPGKVGG